MTENNACQTVPKGTTGRSPWALAARRWWRRKWAVAGAALFAGLLLLCFLGPLALPDDFAAQNLELGATPPNARHWMGTDTLGRDLFARALQGGRISLGVGFLATAVALSIGVTYGAISGYVGGRLDSLLMRLVDILYCLPFTIFVVLLMVFTQDLGKRLGWGPLWTLAVLFAAIGAVEWLTMARLVRAQVQALKQQDFVSAAIALGLPAHRIVTRHLLPNLLGPVAVYATLTVPSVMLLEAALSFLGLGVPPPLASWGVLINDGKDQMTVFPWLLLGPASLFSLTLLALNFMGDGLRDALDPRLGED